MRYASDGNDNALEDPVTVTYDIAATGETGGIIPSGAIMVYRNASVTAGDIDSKFICVILQEQARSHVAKDGAVREGEGIYGARSAPKIF